MFFVRLLSRLPLPILYVLASGLYFVASRVMKYRRKVIEGNMRLCFPEKSDKEINQMIKDFYKHFSYVMVETLKLLTISEKEFRRRCSYTISDEFKEEAKKGKSFIMSGTHIGNWEWYVHGIHLLTGITLDTLYKPLSNPFFEKLMYTIRSRFGMTPMPMKIAFREIVKNRDQQKIYGFACDQSPQKTDLEYYTNFFGVNTPFYTGTEKIARKLQLPISYVVMERKKKGYYHFTFDLIAAPPYDKIPEGEFPIMDKYVKRAEADIRISPADWLWSHRRWKYANLDEHQSVSK